MSAKDQFLIIPSDCGRFIVKRRYGFLWRTWKREHMCFTLTKFFDTVDDAKEAIDALLDEEAHQRWHMKQPAIEYP